MLPTMARPCVSLFAVCDAIALLALPGHYLGHRKTITRPEAMITYQVITAEAERWPGGVRHQAMNLGSRPGPVTGGGH